ncbi:phosphorylase family protein [Streptomyces sp. URMC 123]|uniref:phosphorylase family protein n=1 Tax=Streptomyces sp. URMC 123 TaxID=3423403 RepID=UPI003F1C1FA9
MALPLLVTCALGIERLALRRGSRAGAAGPVALLRTGMGPAAARRAVTRALAEDPRLRAAPVLATGFCAGLAPSMRPGDVVLAEETHDVPGGDAGPPAPCRDNGPLGKALAERGLTVHSGPLYCSDRIVRGEERARLAARGAVAVDMESAAVLGAALAAGPRPVAAVRVVVDAPEHELIRFGTLRGGISAFRALRDVLPVFFEWHRSLPLPRR